MNPETTALMLAERLGQALLAARLTLVTAESCSGGGIAWLITSIPGSSRWFESGIVAYANAAKRELLGVSHESLEQYGAVSEQVALAMAQGALARSHADLSVAVTGIAGPEGGTDIKPVGTVCFAWARRDGESRLAQALFTGDRHQVREQAVLMALQGLMDLIESGN